MVVEKKQRLLGALPGVDDVLGWERSVHGWPNIPPWWSRPSVLPLTACGSRFCCREDDMVDGDLTQFH